MVIENLLYKHESYEIVGCCMEVHRQLGAGFLEIVYKDALEIEFINSHIGHEREKELRINYKGRFLNRKFYADFFVMDKIILEVKATREAICKDNIAQTLHYLEASDCKLALIINF
jgi:GxxExxY protein